MKHRFVDGMIGGIIVLVLALLIFSLTGSVEA